MEIATERFPFPLPRGWFAVAWEDDVAPGAVAPLRAFARDLVLFRMQGGGVAVLDAHCPHLGAHLGCGGTVVDETIRCPFHHWRFAGDGACVEVPYARRVPAAARVRAWPTVERNGLVWVWNGAAGDAPEWEVPLVPEYGDPRWTGWDRLEWTIRTHNQEVAENTADPAHFAPVHGFPSERRLEVSFEGHRFRSVQRWTYGTREGGRGEASLEVDWRGLGIGITRNRFSGDLPDSTVLGTVTPIDAERVHVRFSVCFPRRDGGPPPPAQCRAVLAETDRQMRQDIPIWEAKRFLPVPALCDGDGPVPAFRRWAQQFY